MSPETSVRTLGLLDDYYAPAFRVEIEGKDLPLRVIADVREIKAVLDIDNVSTVDLKLHNFDAASGTLKYSDDNKLFRPDSRVHVQLGYADRLVSILRGTIQTLTAEFTSDGAPALTVRVFDGLSALSKAPADVKQYKGRTDFQIVEEVAKRHDLHVVTPDADKAGMKPRPLVVQGKKTDLRFLKDIAHRIGFELFMITDPASSTTDLYFGKPKDGSDSKPIRTYLLAWGSLPSNPKGTPPPSLTEFRPTLTTTRTVTSVEIRSWNADAKEPIVYRFGPEPAPGGAAKGKAKGTAVKTAKPAKSTGKAAKPAASGPAKGDQAEKQQIIVIDRAVDSLEEAEALATALLKERSDTYLTATGKAIGLPDLRPGDNLEIHGVGATFNGTYYVPKVTHTLGNSGLLTDFEVRRPKEGELGVAGLAKGDDKKGDKADEKKAEEKP